MAPAEALFVVCDGQVRIGPIVNADTLDQVVARISDESRSATRWSWG